MKIQFQNDKITVFESALYRTTSTVLAWGNAVVIVDPNWLPEEVQCIRDFVHDHYPDRKQFLLFTHADFDHILGYGAFPDAEVIAGKDFVINPLKDEAVQQILDFDDQFYIRRNYPVVYPRVDHVIDSYGQMLLSDDENALLFPAPGHVNNGMVTVFPSINTCIAGDYLSNIEIPMVEFSFTAYEKTLLTFQEICSSFKTDLMITGHGDAAFNGQAVQARIMEDLTYIRAFLYDFDPHNPTFEACIRTKGNIRQNIKIHESNLLFYKKTGGDSQIA